MQVDTIAGWVKTIESEILDMDISSRKLQSSYWFDFVEQVKEDLTRYEIPALVDRDITNGWYQDRFLDWSNMEIEMHLRPVSDSIWKRIQPAFQLLFQSKYPAKFENRLYQTCAPDDKNAKRLSITFTKLEGKISYKVKFQETW